MKPTLGRELTIEQGRVLAEGLEQVEFMNGVIKPTGFSGVQLVTVVDGVVPVAFFQRELVTAKLIELAGERARRDGYGLATCDWEDQVTFWKLPEERVEALWEERAPARNT